MTRLTIRPQPLGVLPLPAGYLVVPPVAQAEAICAELVAGRVPGALPAELRFYQLALAGDTEAALAALADDPSAEARYNRFVLGGDMAGYPALRRDLSGDLALLCDLVAYVLGGADAPPDPGDADGELAAVIGSAQAAHAIEQGRHGLAAAALERAAELARPASPLLAAQILGDLADLKAQLGRGEIAAQHLRDALALTERQGLPELRAQLAMRLGICYQEIAAGRRGMLLEAARCYQEALKVYTRAGHPELFALAQNNLALAYLAIPLTEASDQLRMGIAVQGLREALKVYTPEVHPERWAAAQLNLANALQYLPSAHPEDHLAEAVEIYEALLGALDLRRDPLRHARILANQGNALAHLGIFSHARAKLAEAAALFQRHGDAAAAEAVTEALAGIDERAAITS